MKEDGLIIYVKNEDHRDEIQRKYPEAKAEFIITKGMDDTLPMVCITKNGKERCETGESFIDDFSKEIIKTEE
jgi:hypothetical protein